MIIKKMAKLLTIQDLRNNILSNYKIKGAYSKCDFSKFYDKPQEIINYDPTCFLNGMPDFMRSFRQFDYRNSLEILNKVAKKRYEENSTDPGIDYSDPNNFVYYDKTKKVYVRK